MSIIVYLITNRVNGKRYVGITTKSLQKRWQLHINSANAGSYYWIHKAIRKYGADAFEVEELGVASDWKTACQIETTLIAFFKTFWLDGRGYNQTRGGDGNASEWSQEMREKHRKAMSRRSADPRWREHCRRIAQGNTNRHGVVLDSNTKRRMSAAKVRHRFTFNGETLSAYEWSIRTGIRSNTIYMRIKNGWSVEKALTTPV